jgi:ACS family D-galactonate transporter-like MFS transporter
VSASLSGWLLHVGGSYKLPMMAIFGFLIVGAVNTVVLLQRKWAPKIGIEVPVAAPPAPGGAPDVSYSNKKAG